MTDDEDTISLARRRDDPTALAFRAMAKNLCVNIETEIRKAVERHTGMSLPQRRAELIEALRASGHRFGARAMRDGREDFYVNEVLVLTIYPTELKDENGVVTASRRVRHWGPTS